MQRGKEGIRKGAEKVFMSPREHANIPKRATNLDDFQRDVLCRTIFEYYDKGEFHADKKVKFALQKKKCV
jgi:hypothetical protein